jgi:uncharacterized protein YwgA
MSGTDRPQFNLANDLTHAFVAYLVGRYNDVSGNKLGRTILQKLCYFAEASGVPLGFRFGIYHYGPFSQEVFRTVDALLVDDVIEDALDDPAKSDYKRGGNWRPFVESFDAELTIYKATLDTVAATFSQVDPSEMELVSTIHYIHNSYREWSKKAPPKEEVVDAVLNIKKAKFDREYIRKVYDILSKAGLLRQREDAVMTA